MRTGRNSRTGRISRSVIETLEQRQLLAGTAALAWSSYLGGTDADGINDVAFDAAGNVWVVGYTYSSGWTSGGADSTYNGGATDAFVAKINADGTLAWSSYLGGSDRDQCDSIAVDAAGNAWVTGFTYSSGWTSGGLDNTFNGGTYDAFVAKINADGTVAWSSYLGGSGDDRGYGVAVDAGGNAWVTGTTGSSGWVSGGFDSSYDGSGDAFVTKIDANGTLAWSSYLGGSGEDEGYNVSVDASGNVWAVGYTVSSGWTSGGFDTSYNGGEDGFVAKINADGTLAWSSYMGGDDEDYCESVALDAGGNGWIVGFTMSSVWAGGGSPRGGADAFVVKVNANGMLVTDRYLGGSGTEWGYDVACDASGNAWVTGLTSSSGWVSGGFDTSYGGGFDAFLVQISSTGTPVWSTYLGGTGGDGGTGVAIDASGNACIVGNTDSSGWTSGGFGTSYNGGGDGFVAKIRLNNAPTALDLSSSTIAENRPAGTAVGTLNTTDLDSGESFVYSLVSGSGSDSNASFTVVGNELRTNASFDYENKSSYSIRVRTTDAGGLWFEKEFTISVSDVDEIAPTIAATSINDGAVQRSMVTRLTLTFSEQVTLAPDTLAVRLSTGQAIPGTTIRVTRSPADVRTYILTFSGSAIIGGSLPDGIFDLSVAALGVQDTVGNVMTANYSRRFHRLFGDSDGNKIVNALDYARLKQAFGRAPSDPLFNSAFDYEGNGLVNALDLARFRQRYGMSFSY